MKTKIVSLLALLLLVSLPATATPPDSVTLSWDPATQSLTVKAAHYSLAPKSHYIKTFQVSVDGKDVTTKEFTSQSSAQAQEATIPLTGVKPGSVIVVTATCNIYGSGQGRLEVK